MGEAAKRVIGGYLHSYGISHIFNVSHIADISDICLPLEEESLFYDRTRGFGKATGVVALLVVGVIFTSSPTSILRVPSSTSLSFDNTNN